MSPNRVHHYLARYGIHRDDAQYELLYNFALAGFESLGMRSGFADALRKRGIAVADWDPTVGNLRGKIGFVALLHRVQLWAAA